MKSSTERERERMAAGQVYIEDERCWFWWWDKKLSQTAQWICWSASTHNTRQAKMKAPQWLYRSTVHCKSVLQYHQAEPHQIFTLSAAVTTDQRQQLWMTPPLWSSRDSAHGISTHRLIGEGGRLRGCHVVIRRLKRKLLHFFLLVEMNHLRETPRAQRDL